MDWLEITVYTNSEDVEALVGRLEALDVGGLVINDEASIREFLETNPKAWDYIGEEVFENAQEGSSVQFYLEDSEQGLGQLENCRASLRDNKIKVKRVRDEDWMNNWRAYFKPLEIGRRLLIVPEWEDAPATSRIILKIEPGQVFGTGAHASTRMCLSQLEEYKAEKVLDLGCGSGILAVGALLFGAEKAVCCDIAPDAEAVCYENARLNGIDTRRIKAHTCDILDDRQLHAIVGGVRYGIVFANIIADVIIPLSAQIKNLLTAYGVFICSGIIDGRQDEVKAALHKNGLQIVKELSEEDWHMFVSCCIV